MGVDDLSFDGAVVSFVAESILLTLSTINIRHTFSQIPCCVLFGPYSFDFHESLLNGLGVSSTSERHEYGTRVESRLLLDHIFLEI